MFDILSKYAKFLVGQMPPEHKKFSEIIAKNRMPCERCFDFEDHEKQLGCKYCHKKGYTRMNFQTEMISHLISEKIRQWLFAPIAAFVGEQEEHDDKENKQKLTK